jgi:hypothetical protein
LRPFCDTIAGSLAADTVELADLYTLYRSCVGRLHRWCAASQVHEPMALNPRLMLHACLTSNFISTNILARSDVTTILLALPIPFRAHQDSPWPHPRDPGASRLASHESLHKTTAVRAVRGFAARYYLRPATSRGSTPKDRDHEHHQRKKLPYRGISQSIMILPALRSTRKAPIASSVSRFVKLDAWKSKMRTLLQQSPADL